MSTKKDKKLPTQPYRGTRDFFPEEQRLRNWLFQKMHTTMQGFGYENYEGPILESLDLYAMKSSQEIVEEQLYSLTDRSERRLAIRPEMTPTLARMVASRAKQLARPIRWYSIPTCMRAERPQRGRLREFDQLNVDVLGGEDIDADVEILLTAVELLFSIGGQAHDFTVYLNHRKLIDLLFYDKLQLDRNRASDYLRLLDKRDKLSDEAFDKMARELGLEDSVLDGIKQFLGMGLDEIKEFVPGSQEVVEGLQLRIDQLNELCGDICQFNASIMRGFDYYTSTVFEVFDRHPENRRAVFGGGRYDNLVGDFSGEQLSGIGYGVSDVTLLNFMEVHELTPSLKRDIDVAVLRFAPEDRGPANKLAASLRRLGLNVDTSIGKTKFGKQIQAAEKAGVKAVAFIGDEELKNNRFSVKYLLSGEQVSISLSDIETFKADLSKHQGNRIIKPSQPRL